MDNPISDGSAGDAMELCRIELLRVRVAYMRLYRQYLDLDDEYIKCRHLLEERNE